MVVYSASIRLYIIDFEIEIINELNNHPFNN